MTTDFHYLTAICQVKYLPQTNKKWYFEINLFRSEYSSYKVVFHWQGEGIFPALLYIIVLL